MSKRSDRRQRRLVRRRNTIRDAAIALAFGLIIFGLGVFGYVSNTSALRDYENSSDIRRVLAEVTRVDVHEDKTQRRTGGLPRYYYHAHLSFVVDDSGPYVGEGDFSYELRRGDEVEVEVYRRADGTYAIPDSTSEEEGFYANLPMYAGMCVGGVIGLASVVVLVDAVRKNEG